MSVQAERIRALNDLFRSSLQGGRIMLTRSVNELPLDVRGRIIRTVRTFNDFNLANDPHEEHDFFSFVIDGQKFFSKIDYYDKSMDAGSEDPADPNVTTRVLTIMKSEEW